MSLIEHDHQRADVDDSKTSNIAVGVSDIPTVRASRKARRTLQGWRVGVAASVVGASSVLLLNLGVTVWARSHYRDSIVDGVGTALVGSCGAVAHWSTGLHIVINVLSAIMLGASNYVMQCLSSPTRKEIDHAHARGDYLDVGIASFRNLTKIRWHRVVLWWLLALSSLPLHLLYNSAVFKTIEANNYFAGVVNEDFLQGKPYLNQRNLTHHNGAGEVTGIETVSFDSLSGGDLLRPVQQDVSTDAAYRNSSLWERLDNSRCLGAYATSYVSGRKNVLAISSARTEIANQSVFFTDVIFVPSLYSRGGLAYAWLCEDDPTATSENCNVAKQQRHADAWTIDGRQIDYCLSELVPGPGQCRLQFSTSILIVVIVMNACKALAMLLTLIQSRDAALVTIGDALASFLQERDSLTQGRCMMSKSDIRKSPLAWTAPTTAQGTRPLPVAYDKPVRRRWFVAVSRTRWVMTLGLITAALGAALGLLIAATIWLRRSLDPNQSVFGLGFGTVGSRAIIVDSLPESDDAGLAAKVVLANLPQLVCSMLYFAYNALFTSMLLSHEYSQYGVSSRRKALRVSSPRGKQRSKYFLHLPYTYSLPLIAISTLLHWLISQSLFMVRVTVSQNTTNKLSQLGFSCAPILATILVGSVLLLAAPAFGCRRLASGIPLASSCSAALSAAGHPPEQDVDAAYLEVRWGAVDDEGVDDVGHCSFTSYEVHALRPGRLYAGERP